MSNESLKARVSSNRALMFGYFSLIAGVALFSSAEVFSKIITRAEPYPTPFWLSAIRFTIAGIVFIPAFFSGPNFKLKDIGGIFICSLFSVTLAMTCFYQVALMPEFHLSAPVAAIVFCSNPLFVVFFIPFLVPRFHIGFNRLSGTVIALIGTIIVALPDILKLKTSSEAVLYMFIAAILFALQVPYSKHYIQKYGGKKYLGLLFLFGGLTSMLVAYCFDGAVYLDQITENLWPILGYSLLSCALGFYLYFRGFKILPNAKGLQIAFLKPIIAPVIAYYFLGCHFNTWLIAGVIIILFGVNWAVVLKKR